MSVISGCKLFQVIWNCEISEISDVLWDSYYTKLSIHQFFKKIVSVFLKDGAVLSETVIISQLEWKTASKISQFLLFILFQLLKRERKFYILKFIRAFLQFECEQSHLLKKYWAIFQITVYKFHKLPAKHVTYFIFIFIIVNDILIF